MRRLHGTLLKACNGGSEHLHQLAYALLKMSNRPTARLLPLLADPADAESSIHLGTGII